MANPVESNQATTVFFQHTACSKYVYEQLRDLGNRRTCEDRRRNYGNKGGQLRSVHYIVQRNERLKTKHPDLQAVVH